MLRVSAHLLEAVAWIDVVGRMNEGENRKDVSLCNRNCVIFSFISCLIS